MVNCPFCAIMQGKISAYKLLEDDCCIVILPKKMEAKGHCLVFPKKHIKDIFSCSKDDLNKLSFTIKKTANLLKRRLGATGVNILHASGKDAQQSVFHLHFHVIPRFKNDKIDAWMKKSRDETNNKEMYYKVLKQKRISVNNRSSP